ncbi:MAG TPA: hypothetical protein ENF44_05250 [Deltaproteobacteria bacterium]|nr:hypothetical protein [Deltaproteobacteria bacterium]
MRYFWIFTALMLLISAFADRQKTLKALEIALKRFLSILPAFLEMIILVSVALALVPPRLLLDLLGGKGKLLGMGIAAVVGSVTVMPGFIAFPLCGILLQRGVPYMVLSAFSTTLMMVGVLSYPVERAYFGPKVTVLRNVLAFLIALAVAVATGFFFGEL